MSEQDLDDLDANAGERRKKHQQAAKKAERIVKDDLYFLESKPEFRRWVGRLVQRCGFLSVLDSNDAAAVQRFMGRQSVAFEAVREFDQIVPGFLERVLAARRQFEQELQVDLQKESPQ